MKKLFKFIFSVLLVLSFQAAGAQTVPKWKLADLKAAIANAEKPTIFNFWATFCKPCIEEIPYFEELAKKYDSAGVNLVLISLDLPEAYPQKVQSFVTKRKLTAQIAFLDETNADLFCPAVDESWSGAIPASLFVNNKTGHRKFFEDQLSKRELENEIKEMIGTK